MRSVAHPATGAYCLRLDATVKNVVASLLPVGPIPTIITSGLIGPDGDPACPDGADVFVTTGTETDQVNANFYVVMR